MLDIRKNIFSIPIWGFLLKEQKYQSIDYIEFLLELQQNQISEKKSNFGGYQTHEDLHKIPFFKQLVKVIEQTSNEIISEYTNSQCTSLEIKELWGNINGYRDYNASHIHGGILSGVFYLKTPKNCGRLVFINPAVRSDAHIIKNNDYIINPEPVACIIFPSWLEHYVEPNMSNENRISLSFNLDKK